MSAALDQLAGEARAVDESLKATQEHSASEQGATAGAGAAAGQAAPDGESQSDGAAGSAPGDAEVIQNPAPHIVAALTMARDIPLVRSMLPAAVVAALDDAAIAELAEAVGDLAVKYRWDFSPAVGRWREEVRAALALGSIAWRVYHAAQSDSDEARAARARDVSDAAPAWRDPPNPAAEKKPVEPGA